MPNWRVQRAIRFQHGSRPAPRVGGVYDSLPGCRAQRKFHEHRCSRVAARPRDAGELVALAEPTGRFARGNRDVQYSRSSSRFSNASLLRKIRLGSSGPGSLGRRLPARQAGSVHHRVPPEDPRGVIRRQQQELLELSTPVVRLWDGVLALPLIGTLDSARTQVVMEACSKR